jgi:DNA polymerase-3 subunit beta
MMILKRNELKEKLNILSKAYSQKTAFPSLQFVKFDNDTLTVSNHNATIVTKFNTGIQALIPFRQLSDIANKLTAEDLDLTINDNQAVIKCGRSKFTLNLGDFNEFPNYSVLNDMEALKVNCSEFISVISNINYATSNNEKRSILTGVNFSEFAVATDSFRLARIDKDLGLRCTIARSDIDNLISILKGSESVLIRNTKNTATFTFDDTIYQTRLLDGNYPDTSRLIAEDYQYSIKVDRQRLIESIERVNIFNEEYATIILDANNGVLKLSSNATQVGDATDLLECECNNNIKFACNGDYLKDALSKFKKDVIELNLVSSMKPITIKEDDMVALVLPVKVE